MGLAEHSQVGPYLVLAPLGAGGMGEVYRARDSRLGREVALKILPPEWATQPDRLQRFQREARTVGSLSHPNVVAIYDVGRSGDLPYLVSELLEGVTLGERLRGGPLPPRKVVEIALQMARGLAAVHGKGIVHRDLKPDNVFLTRDGHVKLLDFGLAKPLLEEDTGYGDWEATTSLGRVRDLTEAGVVMGTVSYMSPEQVRGGAADERSDIFSFGVVLYEMLSGRRPFRGPSLAETMNAILREEPADLEVTKGHLPPALDRMVRHCLEKAPESRFQSAQDLAFDLEALAASDTGSPPRFQLPRLREALRRGLAAAGAGLAALLLLGAAYGAGRSPSAIPAFQRLTFRSGWTTAARFADRGQSVVYSAALEDEGPQIFLGRPGSPESRGLGLDKAHLLAISSKGELAVTLRNRSIGWISFGTLARVPLAGGAPREVLEFVQGADWDPPGEELAVIRYEKGLCRLEYPAGHVLAQGEGWYSHVRFDPEGKRLAFLEHPIRNDDRGWVAVVGLDGRPPRAVTPTFSSVQGLAWGPGGSEIWFTAADSGVQRSLRATTPRGTQRALLDVPGGVILLDVGPRGEALLSHTQTRSGIQFYEDLAKPPKELSWLNWSLLHGLSPDGKWVVFDEEGVSEGPDYGIYLRATDGSPAVKLGEGVAPALSPDRRWVLAGRFNPSPSLVLLPTGAGTPRVLPLEGLQAFHAIFWLPDGQRYLLFATERGKGPMLYLQALSDRSLKPIRGPSFLLEQGGPLSPDGRWICLRGEKGSTALLDLEHPERPLTPIPGLEAEEQVAQWTEDPGWVYLIRPGGLPQSIVRLRLADGKREGAGPIAGSSKGSVRQAYLTPDGRHLAYSYTLQHSDLYWVSGLR